jgi:hypothetical protein
MFSTRIPRPVPSLESRILRAIIVSHELAAIAAEAVDDFTSVQYRLLFDELEALEDARNTLWFALFEHAFEQGERTEALRRILDHGGSDA